MTPTSSKEIIHQQLVRTCLAGPLSEADALLWMVLLHTHVIRLQVDAIPGADGLPQTVAPLTQRGAAEVMAAVWPDVNPQGNERSDYAYWYRRYSEQTPYEVLEDMPALAVHRLIELRDSLARDPRVAAVEVED